jgi:hypothetical protein
MDLKEAGQNFKKFAAAIAANRKKEAILICQDATALMINRLQNKGTNSEGNKFKLYSDNPLPIFYFQYKNAPSKVESFKKKVKEKKTEPTYKSFRSNLGLPTDKRTHTLTGDMFGSIRPEIESHDDEKTVVVIKANDRLNQDKINWNSNLMGLSIIGLNKGEVELITAAQRERLNKLRKEFLK